MGPNSIWSEPGDSNQYSRSTYVIFWAALGLGSLRHTRCPVTLDGWHPGGVSCKLLCSDATHCISPWWRTSASHRIYIKMPRERGGSQILPAHIRRLERWTGIGYKCWRCREPKYIAPKEHSVMRSEGSVIFWDGNGRCRQRWWRTQKRGLLQLRSQHLTSSIAITLP